MTTLFKTTTLLLISLLTACSTPQLKTDTTPSPRAAVVSASAHASNIGADILNQGGNAVDAAIATAFALAVTWPQAGNIGGGGFMMIAPPNAPVAFIDYRETAPAAAHVNTFIHHTDRHHLKMVGVPGTVRGLHLAHQTYANLPWQTLLQPAITLAAQGFTVDEHLARSINNVLNSSPPDQYPELHRVYANPLNRPWQTGDTLTLPDLAATLIAIAIQGPDAFYIGATAKSLAQHMAQNAGLITTADLANYRAITRTPIQFTFRGYDLFGPPPPSSGGVTIALALNILNHLPLDTTQPLWSAHNIHLITEATRHAFRERAAHLGDPDFNTTPALPINRLTSKAFAKQIAATIDTHNATPSAQIAGDIPLTLPAPESPQTTHFSVIDAQGMAVSNTYTLEASWGTRHIAPGTGFILNNEMGDFNWRPGHTNTTGAIGTPPNLVAPNKRMLSSMSPFIVKRDNQTVLITGSPGGRTIINTVLTILLRHLAFDEPIQQAVNAPRLHHQWFPDTLKLENPGHLKNAATTTNKIANELRTRGHNIQLTTTQGSAHSIAINPTTGAITPAPDPRRGGHAAAISHSP